MIGCLQILFKAVWPAVTMEMYLIQLGKVSYVNSNGRLTEKK